MESWSTRPSVRRHPPHPPRSLSCCQGDPWARVLGTPSSPGAFGARVASGLHSVIPSLSVAIPLLSDRCEPRPLGIPLTLSPGLSLRLTLKNLKVNTEGQIMRKRT
ncbi:hypothetical protein PVAP13_1KG131700 [Panicum virgatum]|uniref:Uncharacterized protein n=1 Tax=Panicum virgatum TaxID=38727 RepID=A0A8T0XD62_PANVG|nr:hypothetical protein PVAP13_1KG131700 [Panicum virgatum]